MSPFVLQLFGIFVLISQVHRIYADNDDSGGYKKVKLTLFYEVLCPDCSTFIKKHLWPCYQEIGEIMDVELVPFGNANQKKDEATGLWKFSCQHGARECRGNMIETCAISELGGVGNAFPFIVCYENKAHTKGVDMDDIARECAAEVDIDIDPIIECADGTKGNNLMHMMAEKTRNNPVWISFVPWINVNGEHSNAISGKCWNNLKQYMCDLYEGPKPAACSDSSEL